MRNVILARLRRALAKMDITTKCPATPFKVGDPIGDTEVVNASALKSAGALSKNLIDFEDKADNSKLYTKQYIDTTGEITAVELAKILGNEGSWVGQEQDKLYTKLVDYIGGNEFTAKVEGKEYTFKTSSDNKIYTKGTNASGEKAFFIKVVRTDDESLKYNCFFNFTTKIYYLGVADAKTKTWTNEVYPMISLEDVNFKGYKVVGKDKVVKKEQMDSANTIGELAKHFTERDAEELSTKKYSKLCQKIQKGNPVASIRKYFVDFLGYDSYKDIPDEAFVKMMEDAEPAKKAVRQAMVEYAKSVSNRARENAEAPLTDEDEKALGVLGAFARSNTDVGVNEDFKVGTTSPSGNDLMKLYASGNAVGDVIPFSVDDIVSILRTATK